MRLPIGLLAMLAASPLSAQIKPERFTGPAAVFQGLNALAALIFCLVLTVCSEAYAQYRNPEVPVPDLKAVMRYGHLLDPRLSLLPR